MTRVARSLPAALLLGACAAAAAGGLAECRDSAGNVLLTKDREIARICRALTTPDETARCNGAPCRSSIERDDGGRIYINGFSRGTAVRYPVPPGAASVTISIRTRASRP